MLFSNKTFQNETIDMDNNAFNNCIFKGCVLVYRGGQPPAISNCSLIEETTFSFVDAAAATLAFMAAMYHGGFQVVIEQTFDNIRKNPKGPHLTH